jgi:hypothetical protein
MSIEVTKRPFWFTEARDFHALKAGRVAVVDSETIIIKGTKKVGLRTLKKEAINANISDVVSAATNPLRAILGQSIIFYYKNDDPIKEQK